MRNLLFTIILTKLFVCLSAQQQQTYVEVNADSNSFRRGAAICVSPKIYKLAFTMIYHLRWAITSKLPIMVCHCDELSKEMITNFESLESVIVVDICTSTTSKKKARSWFCKILALIASPFEDTMIIDSDVIWFQNPEILFTTNQYKTTGTLFFRDKWLNAQPGDKLSLTLGTRKGNYAFKYSSSLAIYNQTFNYTMPKLTPKYVAKNNGFWLHLATKKGKTLDYLHETSVFLYHKPSHPKSLILMKLIYPTFHIGYGEKEIFWMTAEAVGEQFVFEPHFIATVGNCGPALHYDPRVQSNEKTDVNHNPFFFNAEHFIEEIQHEGQFIDDADYQNISLPVRCYEDMVNFQMYDVRPVVNLTNPWLCGTCEHFSGCGPIPPVVPSEVHVRQRMLLSYQRDASAVTMSEIINKHYQVRASPFHAVHKTE